MEFVAGKINQNDAGGPSACLATAFAFMNTLCRFNNQTTYIESSMIDEFTNYGKTLYDRIIQEIGQKYAGMGLELSNIVDRESYCNFIGNDSIGGLKEFYTNVDEFKNILRSGRGKRCYIVVSGGQAVCIYHYEKGTYFIFDSHARGGIHNPNITKSYLLKCGFQQISDFIDAALSVPGSGEDIAYCCADINIVINLKGGMKYFGIATRDRDIQVPKNPDVIDQAQYHNQAKNEDQDRSRLRTELEALRLHNIHHRIIGMTLLVHLGHANLYIDLHNYPSRITTWLDRMNVVSRIDIMGFGSNHTLYDIIRSIDNVHEKIISDNESVQIVSASIDRPRQNEQDIKQLRNRMRQIKDRMEYANREEYTRLHEEYASIVSQITRLNQVPY